MDPYKPKIIYTL